MLLVPNVNASINDDDAMTNDVPPNGQGLFCDHPFNPGSCYDRNDNPEEFCVNNPEYTKFCEVIGPICDNDASINAIQSIDPECTEEGLPCPENFVRYNEYCEVDCDLHPESNVYCNGKRGTDGLSRCDEPNHPGYRFL